MKSLLEQYEKYLDLVVYQIYPKSFKDTNHDGIGDIVGIIEKLDYLKDLGINAIWLCPCYKSPNYDNGYDISDYRDVAEQFGTLDDMKKLIAQMHLRDMKLFMDFVPNHTSFEHPWFIESKKGLQPYKDFYYWFNEMPNDWQSMFGGSAWEYDKERKQYYLHSYTKEQPDLNWDNPSVRKEMQDVIDYWIDLGVDGFRCDVIDQISKNFKGENCFGPHLHEYIHQLFGREKTKEIFTVGECWADDIGEIEKHCACERGELSTLFQFDHIEAGRKDKFTPANKGLRFVRDILIKWQTETQNRGLLYSIFTDNHDQSLFVSRVADDREYRYESCTCLATMFYLLRGIPFIYQGQEIGIVASEYDSIDSFSDIESINMYHSCLQNGLSKEEAIKKINFGSRDNPRRPFAWDNSEYSGFSDCEPWLACASRSHEINLENDLISNKSVFRYYKELLKLRKNHPAMRKGVFAVESKPEDDCFIYTRKCSDVCFTIVCAFEKAVQIETIGDYGEEVLFNYSDRKKGDMKFRPYETVVFQRDI